MLDSGLRAALAVVVGLILLVLVLPAGAASAQQVESTIFVGRVATEPVTQPRTDGNVVITGRVTDRTGRPLPGIQVRISWTSGSTSAVSSAAGGFQLVIGNGPYQAELTNRPSLPVTFTVDGQSNVRLEFVETLVAPPPSGATSTTTAGTATSAAARTPAGTPTAAAGTASPTGAAVTPTATATATPTPIRSTPTPTAATGTRTPTAAPGTATPTPVLTPVPEIGTPISLAGSAPTARPPSTPVSRPIVRRAIEFEFDTEPWVSAFLYGMGLAAAAAVFYLVVVAIRR